MSRAARGRFPRLLLMLAAALVAVGSAGASDFPAIESFASEIKALNSTPPDALACTPSQYGDGWNAHALCPQLVGADGDCFYISYGVAQDWSFDRAVTESLKCSGAALDPTVDHPVLPMEGVVFVKLGAKMLTPSPFAVQSVPWFRRWIGHRRIFALKLDCEVRAGSSASGVNGVVPTYSYSASFAVEA
jgi:hypothetical protein